MELVNALRSNFAASKLSVAPSVNGNETSANGNISRISYKDWTSREADLLYVPSVDFSQSGLSEEKSQYEITAKLFFLPKTPSTKRLEYAEQALNLVLKELHMPCIDLLIVSFPGITFDPDSHCNDPFNGKTSETGDADDFASVAQTWNALEHLYESGLALRIGLAEFGSDRLQHFLPKAKIKPAVDQIFVKEYCDVPSDLKQYADQNHIQLLTHHDCTNILPSGTTRELLGTGEKGAGLLVDPSDGTHGLQGDIQPRWVIKYTAIVRDRGVLEDKGYFAMAELNDHESNHD